MPSQSSMRIPIVLTSEGDTLLPPYEVSILNEDSDRSNQRIRTGTG